jgi:hypothetical protein
VALEEPAQLRAMEPERTRSGGDVAGVGAERFLDKMEG